MTKATLTLDMERAQCVLPTIRLILGLTGETPTHPTA